MNKLKIKFKIDREKNDNNNKKVNNKLLPGILKLLQKILVKGYVWKSLKISHFTLESFLWIS